MIPSVEILELRKKRGLALKIAREMVRMTKVELAKRSGLSRSTIKSIEAGKMSWSIDTEMMFLRPINENIKN